MATDDRERIAGLKSVPHLLQGCERRAGFKNRHRQLQQFLARIPQTLASAAIDIEQLAVEVMHEHRVRRLIDQDAKAFFAVAQRFVRLLELGHIPQCPGELNHSAVSITIRLNSSAEVSQRTACGIGAVDDLWPFVGLDRSYIGFRQEVSILGVDGLQVVLEGGCSLIRLSIKQTKHFARPSSDAAIGVELPAPQ